MSDATNPILEEAYALIEADQLDEAQALLKPLLADDPDNVDGWWLYAHAVKDPETARMALNNVLKLDPVYPGATELMHTLEERFPLQPAAVASSAPHIKRLEPPATLPDLPEDEDIDDPLGIDEGILPDDLDEEPILEDEIAPPKPVAARRGPSPIWLAAGALLALLLLIAFFLLRGGSGGPVVPTPTSVGQAIATITSAVGGGLDVTEATTADVQMATEEATELLLETAEATESTDLATAEATELAAPTLETTADMTEIAALSTEPGTEAPEATAAVDAGGALLVRTPAGDAVVTAVQTALSGYSVVEGSIGTQDTLLGTTLLADVCTTSGTPLRDTLYGAMNALASASTSVEAGTQAIGLRLVDCDSGAPLRVIAAPLESASSFAAGSIDVRTFQSRWVAVA